MVRMPGIKRKRTFSSATTMLRRAVRPGGSAVRSTRMRKSRVRSRSKKSLAKALSMHSYSRYATTPDDYSLTSTELDGSPSFLFNLIKGYSEFTALYDRYRITSIQLNVTLITDPTAANPTNINATNATTYYNNPTNWYPKFWYVRDYDDDTTITLAVMRERSGVKMFIMRPNKVYRINVRPAILNQTYRTSTTTGYAPKWRQWIDMAQTDVPHYGLKWILDTQGLDPSDSYPFKIRIEYKYFFTCKDVL